MLFIQQLPFPKYTRGSIKSRTIEYTLPENLYVEQFTIPKGTIVKLHTTINFGWLVTPDLGKTRRIFKY